MYYVGFGRATEELLNKLADTSATLDSFKCGIDTCSTQPAI
jgi:hypothetical protein